MEKSIFQEGISCIDLLIKAGFTSSKGEARRLIKGRGARINDLIIEDEKLIVTAKNLIENMLKISSGKKKHILIKLK